MNSVARVTQKSGVRDSDYGWDPQDNRGGAERRSTGEMTQRSATQLANY